MIKLTTFNILYISSLNTNNCNYCIKNITNNIYTIEKLLGINKSVYFKSACNFDTSIKNIDFYNKIG